MREPFMSRTIRRASAEVEDAIGMLDALMRDDEANGSAPWTEERAALSLLNTATEALMQGIRRRLDERAKDALKDPP